MWAEGGADDSLTDCPYNMTILPWSSPTARRKAGDQSRKAVGWHDGKAAFWRQGPRARSADGGALRRNAACLLRRRGDQDRAARNRGRGARLAGGGGRHLAVVVQPGPQQAVGDRQSETPGRAGDRAAPCRPGRRADRELPPGTMESWGLGPEDIRATNPGIVYARISGYGQDGPYASRPGYASVCEGVGGLRFVNGFPGQPPVQGEPQSRRLADRAARRVRDPDGRCSTATAAPTTPARWWTLRSTRRSTT